jgi:DNA-binding transcriptional MerR regulator
MAPRARQQPAQVIDGLSTPAVCALVGVPLSTLEYWVRTGLVSPSIRPSVGKRATRWWSISDVVVVRAIKALRQAGCPLQRVREVKTLVEGTWGEPLESVVLYWDGSDVLGVERWGTVRSALKHPGQQMFHLVALPMDAWRREVEESAEKVNVSRLRASDASRPRPVRTPTTSIKTAVR